MKNRRGTQMCFGNNQEYIDKRHRSPSLPRSLPLHIILQSQDAIKSLFGTYPEISTASRTLSLSFARPLVTTPIIFHATYSCLYLCDVCVG
jgi:hypothetical protein